MIVLVLAIYGYRQIHTNNTQSIRSKATTEKVEQNRNQSSKPHRYGRLLYHSGKYQVMSTNWYPLMDVKPNAPVRTKLRGKKTLVNVQPLFKDPKVKTNQVQISGVALLNKKPRYYEISRQGQKLGWVRTNSLKRTSTYRLPYVYTSQFWPSPAKDACEIAALKIAMSIRGKAVNVPLLRIVKRIPINKDPNKGYTANPYHYGDHATIYPKAMVKIARKYGTKAYNITGASKQKLVREVKHGDGVVFDGPYMMKKPGSDHDLTIIGYKPGSFYVTDPFARHRYNRRATWVSTDRMMRLFSKKFRGRRATLIE